MLVSGVVVTRPSVTETAEVLVIVAETARVNASATSSVDVELIVGSTACSFLSETRIEELEEMRTGMNRSRTTPALSVEVEVIVGAT